MKRHILSILLSAVLLLSVAACAAVGAPAPTQSASAQSGVVTLENLPEFSGEPYVVLYNNTPNFTEADLTNEAYEYYSLQDNLGRCGVAMASIGQELMPTEERGSIGQVKPSGWQTVKYDFVDGKYLYNRCHLIGFQLTGENANENNLITGTRYMNVVGMLPFENMVADYIKETGNHVLYRVTPVYEGLDLVAKGVVMEAKSVEDSGEGIEFHVFCYNNQPGVVIDYATGKSRLAESDASEVTENFVLNTNTKKFHSPDCSGVKNMKSENRQDYQGTRQMLLDQGYAPCGQCDP